MKAISVQNPYATWILLGEKTIEVRSWQTEYRGDLLICSSGMPKIPGMISGCAMCIVSLDDVKPFKKSEMEAACLDEYPGRGNYSWHISNVRIVKPVPVKGKLNFYNVDDALIEIIDDGTLSREESDAIFEKYVMPASYKYEKIGLYLYEKSTETIVRWRVGQDALEYISNDEKEWQLTESGSKYEQAFYEDDEGVEWEEMTEKQAHKLMDSWGIAKPYDE